MELESLRAYLLKKKGVFEDFPFGPEVMVFKEKHTQMAREKKQQGRILIINY